LFEGQNRFPEFYIALKIPPHRELLAEVIKDAVAFVAAMLVLPTISR
jgi:hypothetical protein